MKKFCENCGAQLEEDDSFCPECGAAQIEEKSDTTDTNDTINITEGQSVADKSIIENKKTKKKSKKIFVVVLTVIVVLGVVVMILGGGPKKFFSDIKKGAAEQNEVIEKRKQEKAEDDGELLSETEETKEDEIEEDDVDNTSLQRYVGQWQDREEDIYALGGVLLTIKEVDNDFITFYVTKAGAGNKIVETNEITAQIKDNVVEFKYDDSFDNSGDGMLVLKEDSVNIVLTDTNTVDQNYSAACNAKLKESTIDYSGERTVENAVFAPPNFGTYIQGSAAPFVTITNITETTFDFEIFASGGSTIFNKHTATITDEGQAKYNGTDYNLTFEYNGMMLRIYGFDIIGNPGEFEWAASNGG